VCELAARSGLDELVAVDGVRPDVESSDSISASAAGRVGRSLQVADATSTAVR
jgi:hypothetical protein